MQLSLNGKSYYIEQYNYSSGQPRWELYDGFGEHIGTITAPLPQLRSSDYTALRVTGVAQEYEQSIYDAGLACPQGERYPYGTNEDGDQFLQIVRLTV